MKQFVSKGCLVVRIPFSILERIDVGETATASLINNNHRTFSILERIDVGETRSAREFTPQTLAFSILERIDVGETCR